MNAQVIKAGPDDVVILYHPRGLSCYELHGFEERAKAIKDATGCKLVVCLPSDMKMEAAPYSEPFPRDSEDDKRKRAFIRVMETYCKGAASVIIDTVGQEWIAVNGEPVLFTGNVFPPSQARQEAAAMAKRYGNQSKDYVPEEAVHVWQATDEGLKTTFVPKCRICLGCRGHFADNDTVVCRMGNLLWHQRCFDVSVNAKTVEEIEALQPAACEPGEAYCPTPAVVTLD